MCYQILVAMKVIYQDEDFEIVKQHLCDLIEFDKSISNATWEKAWLMDNNELPFKAGKYIMVTGEWQE